MIYWLAALQTVPEEYLEAAPLDGAGTWALLRHIRLPILLPFALINIVLTAQENIHAFGIVQALTGGGPYFRSQVLEVHIYQTAFEPQFGGVPRLGYASAAGCFFGTATLIFALIQLWVARKVADMRSTIQVGGVINHDAAAGAASRRPCRTSYPCSIEAAGQESHPRPVLATREDLGDVISIILITICLAWIYPFIWTVASSFKSTPEIFGSINPFGHVLRLSNWVRAWTEAGMGRFFLNSVFVTVGSFIIAVLTSALMGYVLGRYAFPGKKVLVGALALVIFLPEGYTIIPIYDLIAKLHLSGSLWGVTLVEAGGVHIISVLLFAGYFGQLPKSLEESARVDGAGFVRTFFRIYLPLAKPVTATAIILQFMHSWNDFLLPLVLTMTRPELKTLAVGVYALRNDYFADWGVMAAASSIAMIPIIVLFLLLQRNFVESIAGAVKV